MRRTHIGMHALYVLLKGCCEVYTRMYGEPRDQRILYRTAADADAAQDARIYNPRVRARQRPKRLSDRGTEIGCTKDACVCVCVFV